MELESQPTLPHQYQSAEMRSEKATGTSSKTLARDLGNFLSFSCRSRAEDFARTLQFKLKTLGSFDSDTNPTTSSEKEERSWKSLSLDSDLPPQTHSPTVSSPGKRLNDKETEAKHSENSTSPNQHCNGTKESIQSQSSQRAQDSDIYYDFDLGSPGSPDETGSCYGVVNPCDDLYCSDCVHEPQKNDSIHNNSPGCTVSVDPGLESGCVFSSPASNSPDGNTGIPVTFHLQPSNSADDCRSDTSDCSIYYDVEPFSPIPSPKPEMEELSMPEMISEMEKMSVTESNEKEKPVISEKGKQILASSFGITTEDLGSSGEEDDNSVPSIPRVMRCSSLKTGKTPPGTPGTKKIVRFADALGLDLTAVKTFMDEIPKIPNSAFKDLKYPLEPLANDFARFTSFTSQSSNDIQFNKTLVPTFHQPCGRSDFFDQVRDNKVLLENAFFSDNFTVKGTVRVLNMDFHKSVYIRYTYDEWKTFTDFQATYVNGSCDGFSDKFEFKIQLKPESVEIGGRVILAVRFHCKGEQFWDNNYGADYLFHCIPAASPTQASSSYDPATGYPSTYGNHPEDPWINHMWL